MTARRREPLPGVFRLVLPLPFPGLDRVNAYLLADGDRATLVDCGIHDPSANGDHGWNALAEAVGACGMAISDIARVVITHTHIDHYGMAGRVVAATGCELLMHRLAEVDLEFYRDPPTAIDRLRALFAEHGVGPREVEELTAFEDWSGFVSDVVDASTWLDGGETLRIGGRRWDVIHTPGHAASHVCLWTPDTGALVSGDHLLATVTPHIDFRRGETKDPLGEYLTSLQVTEELDPRVVLPGHGRPFEDGGARARAIARHHDRRLGSILQVVRHEAHTADEITDEIFGTTLLNFQRRLALGEALAHLVYLEGRGEVERARRDDGTYEYRKPARGPSQGDADG